MLEGAPRESRTSRVVADEPLLPLLPADADRQRIHRVPRESALELDAVEDLVRVVLTRGAREEAEVQERLDLAGDRGRPEGVLEARVDDRLEDGDQALVRERLAATEKNGCRALQLRTKNGSGCKSTEPERSETHLGRTLARLLCTSLPRLFALLCNALEFIDPDKHPDIALGRVVGGKVRRDQEVARRNGQRLGERQLRCTIATGRGGGGREKVTSAGSDVRCGYCVFANRRRRSRRRSEGVLRVWRPCRRSRRRSRGEEVVAGLGWRVEICRLLRQGRDCARETEDRRRMRRRGRGFGCRGSCLRRSRLHQARKEEPIELGGKVALECDGQPSSVGRCDGSCEGVSL